MNKPAQGIEWQIAENDTDWERLCAQPLPDAAPAPAQAAQEQPAARQRLWGIAGLLLFLAGAAGWWWHKSQVDLPRAELERNLTAQAEVLAVARRPDLVSARPLGNPFNRSWGLQPGAAQRELRAAVPTAALMAPLDVAVDMVTVQGDQAVLHVVMSPADGAPAYRQTRFYRRTATGWQQTVPVAALWGPKRSLETASFVFHFRQQDTAVIVAVAPQLETLYTTMRRNVGLPLIPTPEKLVIEVSVTQTPGEAIGWFLMPVRFRVPSPAVYLAPAEFTDADLLKQSLTLPLLRYLVLQTSNYHATGSTWQPLLNGLHLWQVWDMGLPLSAWREEVVQWIYRDRAASTSRMPEHYTELCAAHKLWMPYPLQIHIPLVCADRRREEAYMRLWYSLDPPTDLDHFALPILIDETGVSIWTNQVNHPGQTVALATLVEYAVVTYGREHLPALVAGLGHYESWDTLLPAVYGVSPAEFEAGWQAYLAAHYGVLTSVNRNH